jgi:hypothetical protein
MKHISTLITLILLLTPFTASAQFFVTGDDPGKLKWLSIESENFKIIYPEGQDSLALVYGNNLEKFRIPISRSMRFLPCGPDNAFNHKMEIVLHTYYGNNGSVAWTPKRMDLYAIPGAYAPEPSPWNEHLSVHELRHVSQIQFGLTKTLKPGNYILGQMWNGLASILYPGTEFMEGDAVIAETAFTKSGRGRVSDFLNYYRLAFDNGDYRKWGHWRFQSQRDYVPSYYALGYLCLGGIRYLHGNPTLMGDALHISAQNPLKLSSVYDKIEEVSGKKFEKAFMEVCDTLGRLWKAEADSRAPYIPKEQVTKEPKIYTNYSSIAFAGDEMYAIKKGFVHTATLVRINPEGKEKFMEYMSSQVSDLRSDAEGGIWWSENKTDERWTLQTGAVIKRKKGSKTRKIGKNALRYNPAPSPFEKKFSVSEYRIKGETALQILDDSGRVLHSFEVPDTLQPVQTAWLSENDIYASAISDNGYGIYHIDVRNGMWSNVLCPQPVMIKDLRTYGQELTFVSDRTGVNEFYHFNPISGELRQKTSIRHGGESFCYSPDGEYLYYTSPTMKGNQVYRTRTEDLFNKDADFTVYHKYVIAEALTKQEKELASQAGEALFPTDSMSTFSQPKRYRKFPHAFNVHSWAPAYISVNNIMNMSFDKFYQALSLGASGLIQNDLSTAVGEFGYSAHKDPYNKAKWRHSGHIKFTYTGLYPVIETSIDFNDRALRQYNITTFKEDTGGYTELRSRELDSPYFQGNIAVYIPFKFTDGGWNSGFIPKVSYTFTNDRFNTSLVMMSAENGGVAGYPTFVGNSEGKNILRQYLSTSVRGYTMLLTPNSAVFPRWGIGLELGSYLNLGLGKYISPAGYAYAYGYIPGFTREQGIKLTALHQQKLSSNTPFGQSVVNVLPRGLQKETALMSSLSITNPSMTKVSIDYAAPIFIGNPVLGINIFAIKRLVLTPSFDCMFFGKKAGLWSASMDVVLDFESIATLVFPVSLGITYSFNGGFNNTFNNETMGRHFFGPVFNISL